MIFQIIHICHLRIQNSGSNLSSELYTDVTLCPKTRTQHIQSSVTLDAKYM